MTGGAFSSGDYSLLAIKKLKKQRDLYIAQNFDQVRKEIAEGRGPHMETLSIMSMCEVDTQSDFNSTLQASFEKIYLFKSQSLGFAIDDIISSSERLKSKCFNLSSI